MYVCIGTSTYRQCSRSLLTLYLVSFDRYKYLPTPANLRYRFAACRFRRSMTRLILLHDAHTVPAAGMCMYVYTYVCMYIHTYVCIYIRMYVYTYVSMYIHTYVCMYIRIYVYTYVCMYFICMYVCVHVCACVCVCVCVFMYV